MKNDNAITVTSLHKSFKLPHEQNSGIKQIIVNFAKRNKGYEVQNVLKDVSFEIKKGEFFGIVGRNGSGKSTLLKLLAGIYTPDKGAVQLNGSLTPFIELGVGFNPELTGRENVYMNGALLGFSHEEMEAKYDDIVTFSELERFMDQKLKNYSSGMQVRLAFSIAIQAESDILLLDEVLAVGDEAFQRKCEEYFNSLKKNKKTVILVTHDMNAVRRYCNRAVMIQDGEIVKIGSPEDVASVYSLENISTTPDSGEAQQPKYSGVENLKIKLLSNKNVDETGEIKFVLEYDVTRDLNTVAALSLTDANRNIWLQNDNSWHQIIKGKGHHKVNYSCRLPKYVNNSIVKVQASVWSEDEKMLAFVDEKSTPKVVIRRSKTKTKRDTGIASGVLNIRGEWEIIE